MLATASYGSDERIADLVGEIVQTQKIIYIITILSLIFIWVHSIIPEQSSAYESLWLTNTVVNPVRKHLGLDSVDKITVRKIAHVIEFLMLSVFTAFYWKGKIVKNIYTGLTVAFLDESIQVITGRGALITDIWLDLIGVGIGTTIGCIIWKSKKR